MQIIDTTWLLPVRNGEDKMKLKELKTILYSNRGNIQFAIVYDSKLNADVESGCSIEYAIEKCGEKEVKHIEAFKDQLLITV